MRAPGFLENQVPLACENHVGDEQQRQVSGDIQQAVENPAKKRFEDVDADVSAPDHHPRQRREQGDANGVLHQFFFAQNGFDARPKRSVEYA